MSKKIKIIISKDGDPTDTDIYYVDTQEQVISQLISYIAMVNSDEVNLVYQGSGDIPRWMRFYPQD